MSSKQRAAQALEVYSTVRIKEESGSKSEKVRRRVPLVGLIRRAVGRPYLLMAAVILVLGAIWFTRLALQEFLLIDRLVNVYTNDAQIKMDAYPIKAGVTAEVLEVLAKEGCWGVSWCMGRRCLWPTGGGADTFRLWRY